ncbi:MAG: helix-turn-helix domain-containing protein [Pseudomonadota bacterium]
MNSDLAIPNYELFGELLAGGQDEPVHLEAIKERSRQHNWTIRIHRHTRLAQIFLFRTAGVLIHVGEIEHRSAEPLILVVPPGMPHGFRFTDDVIGDVLSLRVDKLNNETTKRLGRFSGAGALLLLGESVHYHHVDALFKQLHSVYHGMCAERHVVINSIAHLIVTYLFADVSQKTLRANPNSGVQMTPHETKADAFCKLLDFHFNNIWKVGDYADALSISGPHLTRVCRRILGQSPNDLIRQRRLLEAKRLLEYTRLPISDIAHRSGFRDAAYFSRTFKNLTGFSPQSYRAERDG